jgi:preprotein translocase subunit SecE
MADDRPTESDADAELEREARAAAPAGTGTAPAAPARGGPVAFVQASWAELKRVQWPDRRHVGQGTAVVLGFVIIAGGYLGLLDAVWQPLINAIL